MKQDIPLPPKPKIIEQKGNQAVFEIAPCYSGYGMTLGNALRRVLLSSLPGAAITNIKISSVSHEFAAIPNVLEDVVQIMLNIKKLRLKIFNDEPVKIFLRAKGEKKIKAKDIETPSGVEIVNKDLHIATLTSKNAEIEIEMQAEQGLGFLAAEQQTTDKSKLGMIFLDAIFTPIKKINYSVEDMRVGKRTDFNRLLLDIETDGTITPKEAFEKAGQILVEHFKVFTKTQKFTKEKPKVLKKAKIKSKPKDKKIKVSAQELLVEDLRLSTRTITVLRDNRIKSISNLAKKSEEQLLTLSGMGAKGTKEIRRALGKLGIILKK